MLDDAVLAKQNGFGLWRIEYNHDGDVDMRANILDIAMMPARFYKLRLRQGLRQSINGMACLNQ